MTDPTPPTPPTERPENRFIPPAFIGLGLLMGGAGVSQEAYAFSIGMGAALIGTGVAWWAAERCRRGSPDRFERMKTVVRYAVGVPIILGISLLVGSIIFNYLRYKPHGAGY